MINEKQAKIWLQDFKACLNEMPKGYLIRVKIVFNETSEIYLFKKSTYRQADKNGDDEDRFLNKIYQHAICSFQADHIVVDSEAI